MDHVCCGAFIQCGGDSATTDLPADRYRARANWIGPEPDSVLRSVRSLVIIGPQSGQARLQRVCEVFFSGFANWDDSDVHWTFESMKTLVHASVTTRLDYCNSVLAGAPRSVTDKFQRVLNAAARLVSGTSKLDRGLSRLLHANLHWLDVPDREHCAVQAQCNSAPVSATQSPAVPDWLCYASLGHCQ